MLGSLITSGARRRILALLFSNPAREYYLREIARLAKVETNAAGRELGILEKGGIAVSRNNGNRRYYAVNRACPIYDELKSIILKTEGAGAALARELKRAGGVDFAFIFGSTAKGDERVGSDIDVMVVGKAGIGEVGEAVSRAQKKISREINYFVYPPGEFLGKIGNGFIREIIGSRKVMLVGDDDEFKRFVEGGKDKKGRAG
ncbi:MAG: nucleotidyltransferase domain-containing protein [Candidatus Micrarchaeota archaeon]|nr:nucleotidyltransferase domain-containing protein [Candidatus Micrarchaeota archaeon]